jgi:hypothetical protein
MAYYNLTKIRKSVISKGYKYFSGKNYDVNIIGVRRNGSNLITNTFDDLITVSYRDDEGKWNYEEYKVTTDPGKHWMNHPMNTDGTAILVPGQYRSAYQIGKHQNRYMALVQRKPVKVYRDNDRDNEYDLDPRTIQSGLFGINIHRSNPYTESYYVNKWSAGCQVFKRIKDYNQFMGIMQNAASFWGNGFTYTLLNHRDIIK